MGQIGIVGVAARCTPNFPADRTGSTAKAFSNVTDTAPVVEHGHYNGSFLSGQVGINSWHGSTLQEKVLHLVLEAAHPFAQCPIHFSLIVLYNSTLWWLS